MNGKEKRCVVMFFRRREFLKKVKALQAVSKDFSYIQSNSQQFVHSPSSGRMSQHASLKRRGSMTVEAALVFPIFLFALTALLYLLVLQQLQAEVGRVLTDTGRELSWQAYQSGETGTALAAGLGGRQKAKEYLDGQSAAGIIKNGVEGISFLGSGWDSGASMITLQAHYQVILPPGLSWFHPIRITQSKTIRGWTGFGGRGSCESSRGNEIVYVTDYGTVYHRRLDCQHLKLSIQQKSISEIGQLRNESGAKYYPCEKCWKNGSGVVYITSDGNRCHESLNCSALVRGIHTVRLSDTGGMPPCSTCGG